MGGRKKQRISSSCDTEYFEEEMELEEVHPVVIPKGDNQRNYNRVLYSINKPMIFAVGPAGTGKTMLACCAAIQGYNDRTYKRIVLTRPVVSVEEDIGFLPGTMEEKMDPWTRPIMDIFAEYYTQNDIHHRNLPPRIHAWKNLQRCIHHRG
jgi:phosphate starvation-inducible PhoH-like protein